MAPSEEEESVAADTQLFGLLSSLLHQVEGLTNTEEVELRSKIEALKLQVTQDPSSSARNIHPMDLEKELDKLSAKLVDVDEMISSVMDADPLVQSILSDTADLWMPVITATADERLKFAGSVRDDLREANEKKEG